MKYNDDDNDNNIVVIKCYVKEHNPGEDIEGICYTLSEHPLKDKHDIFGLEILSYEKVGNIQAFYSSIRSASFYLYDANGVNSAYSNGVWESPSHYVKARSIYAYSKDKENELSNVRYIEFTPENYSKFCSLFEKENRMFYLLH